MATYQIVGSANHGLLAVVEARTELDALSQYFDDTGKPAPISLIQATTNTELTKLPGEAICETAWLVNTIEEFCRYRAMENAILVREVATNSQDTVPLDELSNYLKRRRLGSRAEMRA